MSPFHIVDVFSGRPFAGNPVAVVIAPDADDATMREVAGWTGMPETVFVRRPRRQGADYAIRIFSPVRELAFAGHPSIGACHLLLELGRVAPRAGLLMQECPAGLFAMRVEESAGRRRIAFTAFAEEITPVSAGTLAAIGDALGEAPDAAFLVEAGARWIVARYREAANLATLSPVFERILALADAVGASGISVLSPSPDADADIEVRSFAPSIGVDEDAACGGGNACVAAVIAREADATRVTALTVSQGRHLGRRGRLHLTISPADGSILVAGEAVTSVSGTIGLASDAGPARGHAANEEALR